MGVKGNVKSEIWDLASFAVGGPAAVEGVSTVPREAVHGFAFSGG